MVASLTNIDVAVLAGGLGTRLRPVLSDIPKILAPVEGRPFLEYLIDWLESFGARRLILCLGHLADRVSDHLAAHPPRMETSISIETEPLGTAGALRLACPLFRTDPVLVMNGDSFVDADLAAFADFHLSRRARGSLICTEVDDTSRFGRVEVDAAGRIVRFAEKSPQDRGPGLINGGVYLFSATMLNDIAAGGASSLERDVLAKHAPGELNAFCGRFRFIDIGTPETLSAARARMVTRTASAHTAKGTPV